MLEPLIRKLAHFLPLPDPDSDWLNSLVSRSDEFPAHADIVRQQDIAAGAFVISAGHACRYKILPDGGRQILDFMFPGDMTGLHSFLLTAFDHGIFALGPTMIARLDRERLLAEIVDRPYVTLAFWWSALQEEAILRERIAAIGRRDAYARLAHLLCEMFERLRLIGETLDEHYNLPVTQVELADALGMSEVHANRMMRRLQREGLIQADHRAMQIRDLEGLKVAGEFEAGYLHLQGAPRAVQRRLSAEGQFHR